LFSDLRRYKVEVLLLAVTLVLQFYRLDMGELQQWDESLYAVRTKAVLTYGAWLDQTEYAVGGLYSSLHPPLAIWVTAGIVSVLGESTLSYRLFAAICSVIAIFFVYGIITTLKNKRLGIITAVIFGNAQLWLWFAHHGQLDVPMHTALLACIYFMFRSHGPQLLNTILSGLCFAAALLTKAYQPLYIIPFLLLYAVIYKKDKGIRKVSTIISIGILTALPWYLYMILSHPEFIQRWTNLLSSISGGTYNDKPSQGWYFYINQAIINYPLIIALPFLYNKQYLTESIKSRNAPVLLIGSGWMLLSLAGLSILGTKMHHFVLFISIPSLFLIGLIIERIEHIESTKYRTLSIIVSIIAILWSMSEHIRLYVKGDHHQYTLDHPLLITLIICAIIIVWYHRRMNNGTNQMIVSLMLIMTMSNLYRWNIKDEKLFIDGAKKIGSILSEHNEIRSTALIYSGTRYNDLFPQFAYYSEGLNLGWQKGRTADTYTLEKADHVILNGENDAVVLYKEWNRYNTISTQEEILRAHVDSLCNEQYLEKVITRRYVMYYRHRN
jgi:4-amino-4-deoxy-L-arabinose transferase-like glycosyltransferase